MRWSSAAIVLGVWLVTTLARAQQMPPGYDSSSSEAAPESPAPESTSDPEAGPPPPGQPLPPGYVEYDPAEIASRHSPFTPAEEARIRAQYDYLRKEGRRYRLTYPIIMGATSVFSLAYAGVFLREEKDDFFGMPDPTRIRRYRAWVGVSTLMVAGAVIWLINQIIGRRRWKRRFLPVREQYRQLTNPTLLRF